MRILDRLGVAGEWRLAWTLSAAIVGLIVGRGAESRSRHRLLS
jgi:hypothetical protein